jgi:hypothetical protein
MSIDGSVPISVKLVHLDETDGSTKKRIGMNSENPQFSEDIISAVWAKGQEVAGCYSITWRKDIHGSWMKRNDYGSRDSGFGWEIGLIKPLAEGGTYHLDNLQPLYWKNNRDGNEKKNNHFLNSACI